MNNIVKAADLRPYNLGNGKDKTLPSGPVIHWPELYAERRHHKNREFTQRFVPVTCGGCLKKRPIRIEYVRQSTYDGRCPKCRRKKYSGDITLHTGSVVHADEMQGSHVPVTCARCVELGNPNPKQLACRSLLSRPDYTGYCFNCAHGERTGDEMHLSGAIIHWSERESGVPKRMAKIAFTCCGCKQKGFTDAKTLLKENWAGLCSECRSRRGSHNRKSYEGERPLGRVLNERHPEDVNKIGVQCKLCGQINFFTKKMIYDPDFLGCCRTHGRLEIAMALQNVIETGNGQKNGGAEKRKRGRTPKPPEVKKAELQQRRVEFENKVRELGTSLPQHEITRSVIAGEYASDDGEIPDDSTITKWVQEFYGKEFSVPAAVNQILARSRINTDSSRENKSAELNSRSVKINR